MRAIALIYIIFIIAILWIEKIMYKNFYETQYYWNKRMRMLNRRILDNDTNIINENRKLIDENYDLREENQKLKENLNKFKDRVAKVINEEKTNG